MIFCSAAGVPLIVVGISVGVFYDKYGDENL